MSDNQMKKDNETLQKKPIDIAVTLENKYVEEFYTNLNFDELVIYKNNHVNNHCLSREIVKKILKGYLWINLYKDESVSPTICYNGIKKLIIALKAIF